MQFMSDNRYPAVTDKARKVDTALRIAALGVLYAAALFVVVAFSPSLGLVQSHPTGEVNTVAAAPDPGHR
jgi:hypothetical protein